jgi:hypothetical protein
VDVAANDRPFRFSGDWIVHSLIGPLSSKGIGVFVVCTFDGEHVLIASHDRDKSRNLLTAAGHKFIE